MSLKKVWEKLSIYLALGMLTACATASTDVVAQVDGILKQRTIITVPAYDELPEDTGIHRYASQQEYDASRLDDAYILERLVYESDGLDVVAYLYGPSRNIGPRPTVIFNRGSFIRNDAAPELLVTFRRLAQAGFTVVAPMYRGSEGAGGRDELGGEDLNDLMAVSELVKELPSADSNHLFLYGESRGGMMVLQALRDGFPALAAAEYGAPTNYYALLENQPEIYEPIADFIWPDWRERTDIIATRRSAVKWAERINSPLLVMHGAEDESMPVSQSLELVSRLNALGKPYEFVVYGYDNHVLTAHAKERDARAAAWFKRHLQN